MTAFPSRLSERHALVVLRMVVAGRYPGVNANVLTDPAAVDPLSGNAVLNGVPVTVKVTTPEPV